ncbi:MAG: adenylate/guanylate cyclase domain-containing protein [Myxococcota bacterium]|nr:adenylate/guanylate cyclase domain-containing protein [Myxococcota bacterium]
MKKHYTTILFSDIKGYTALSKKIGPERLKLVLNQYLEKMAEIIEGNEGNVNKFLGDGILAFFGAPKPTKSQKKAAAQTALDMHRAVTSLNQKLIKSNTNIQLQIRVGIASGDVMLGGVELGQHQDYTAVGDTVNLASRLQDRAPPGSTLVCANTGTALGEEFTLNAVHDLELKGYSDAYSAWQIVDPLEIDSPAASILRALSSSNELRGTPRQALKLQVKFVSTGGIRTEQSVNISEGGIFLTTENPEPIGTTLSLVSNVPTNRGSLPVLLHGQVVRHGIAEQESGMGIRFNAIESNEIDTIRYFATQAYGLTPTRTVQTSRQSPLEFDEPSKFAVYNSITLPISLERISSGTFAYFGKRFLHEFDRTRRYGHPFSLVGVQLKFSSDPPPEILQSSLTEAADIINSTVRTTDEIFYYKDGIFLILAPETEAGRVNTLTGRVVDSIHRWTLSEELKHGLNCRTRSFCFDGHNAETPQNILKYMISFDSEN